MPIWLSIAYANDFELSSEKEIHSQIYPIYREIQYSMPQISAKTETIDIELSVEHFCVLERHYHQIWKNNAGLFQNYDRRYIQYEVQICPEENSMSNTLQQLDPLHLIPDLSHNNFLSSKIDITNIALQLHNQVHNIQIQDHTLHISIPFSEVGALYLTELMIDAPKRGHIPTPFSIDIFSSNYAYSPITDSPMDIKKRIATHNKYASNLEGNSFLSFQHFYVGEETIHIQPSQKELDKINCSALPSYIKAHPKAIESIVPHILDWPCTSTIQKLQNRLCAEFSEQSKATQSNETLKTIHNLCPQIGSFTDILEIQINIDMQFGLFTQAEGRLVAFVNEIDSDWRTKQMEIIQKEQQTYLDVQRSQNSLKMDQCMQRLSKPTLCDSKNLEWICNGCGTDPDCPCCEYTNIEKNKICQQELHSDN